MKTIVGKYNRRNNPELEKRRIHHCDFMGKLRLSRFTGFNPLNQMNINLKRRNSCIIGFRKLESFKSDRMVIKHLKHLHFAMQ